MAGAIMEKTMLRLRLKNPVPERPEDQRPLPYLAPNSPWKPRIHVPTNRKFHIVSLPQRDGSYVASVVDAPSILVYDESRKSAEEKASKRFLRKPDPHAYMSHPLATTKAVTVDMEFDEDSDSFVTYVKELHGISTYGATELEPLDNTAEMIRGYIKSVKANGKRIPLSAAKLRTLEPIVGIL
jgi:predicted RNase H-like HicB family nuclease